jgi:cytohesin
MAPYPAIHKAVERGNSKLVRQLIEDDPSQAHARIEEGDQPLHFAAWFGRVKIAELLLEAGADINARGQFGKTPLHYAAKERSPKMVELLLRHGADTTIRDSYTHWTALYFPAGTHNEAIVDIFLRYGAIVDINSLLHIEGPSRMLDRLRADPALPESIEYRENFLDDAIRVGSRELVEFLLERGFDPNARPCPPSGLPPLFQAISHRSVPIAESLLRHGADISARAMEGSVLEYARTYGGADPNMISLLREYGAK